MSTATYHTKCPHVGKITLHAIPKSPRAALRIVKVDRIVYAINERGNIYCENVRNGRHGVSYGTPCPWTLPSLITALVKLKVITKEQGEEAHRWADNYRIEREKNQEIIKAVKTLKEHGFKVSKALQAYCERVTKTTM